MAPCSRKLRHFFVPRPLARYGAFASPAQRSSAGAGRQGFILVAVLLLIALATILVVVTSFLARIERRAVSNEGNGEIARQNALFGLDAALAQLQKDVGPDQSVTARADILDINLGANQSSIPQPGVSGVLNPYWTGAWKAYQPGALSQNLDVDSNGNTSATLLRNWSTAPVNGRPDPSSLNMEWLVSGVAADHAVAITSSTKPKIIPTTWTPVYAAGGASPRNAVVLAKLPDLSQTQPTTNIIGVGAPLVPMQAAGAASPATAPTIGQYAYWVSDEGVKAKANLFDSTLNANGGSTYIKNQSHFLASQANLMTNLLPVNSGSDVRSDVDVTRLSTLQSLALLPSINGPSFQNSSAAHFAPDVTTYSLGVLADVRNGGLKRDLSAAFEDDKSVNPTGQFQALLNTCGANLQDQQAVYRSSNAALAVPVQAPPSYTGSTGGTTLDGLRWESLYQYYNLYKSTIPLWRAKLGAATPPSGVPTSSLAFTTGVPYSLQQRFYSYNDGGGGTFTLDPVAPTVLAARVDIGLVSFVDPTTGNYRLRLRYYPTLVLYNPYGVRITTAQNTSYNFYTNFFTINGRWNCIFRVNGIGIPPFDGASPNTSGYSLIQGSGYPLVLNAQPSDVTSFDPGEIKIFELTSDVARSTLGDPSSSNVCNLQNLVNSSNKISADWAQTYDLPWAGTANPNDKVTVSVGNMQLTANVAYESGSPLDEWPDGSANGASNARFQSLNLPTVTPAGAWPAGGLPISSMTGNGYLLVGFNVRSKGIQQTTDVNYANYNYVQPSFVGNNLQFSDVDGGNWREVYARAFKPYSSVSEVSTDNPADGQPRHTSWGQNSVGDAPVTPANSRLPLRDVPCQPMFSLGQFSHMAEWYYTSSGSWENLFFPSRSVGGSFASDFQLNYNNGTNAGNLSGNQIAFDNSFMANQVLFDTYYFSTVPAAAQPAADSSKYVLTSAGLDAAVQNNQPLPNNRLRFYHKNGVAPTAATTPSLSAYEASLRDLKAAATCLLVDGAFNVNSTSVNAWKALLASLSGNSLTLWNYTTGQPNPLATLLNPIPRFWNLTWGGQSAINQAWEGMRTLTADDASGTPGGLTSLARHIVQQVKTRGPFLSMGDFLNRRLGTAKVPLNEMGALQEAIEECTVANTGKNINDAAISAGTAVNLSPAFNSGLGSAPTNSATGIPGYLMQQDLVQAFAPAMSTRSDTFVVRCYGEVNNPSLLNSDHTPQPVARAWGEAVVQRLPDYIDQADSNLSGTNAYGTNLGDATPPYNRITSPTSPAAIVDGTNLTFGRRLKVVSFRWLNESDL